MRCLVILILLQFYSAESLMAQQSPKKHCELILENLISARGEVRDDYPSIQVIERKKKIASYSPVNNQILIEQAAYDICESLGEKADDALAFLISHELTHFFQIHEWQITDQTMAFYDDRATYDQHKKNEAEADRFGAFMCYLAGYDYFNTAPLIIEKLYTHYALKSHSHSYPSLGERKQLSTDVCSVIKHYTIMYQCANYLHLIGEYGISQSIYTYLLDHLDFPEIYHNAGTNQLMAALSHSIPKIEYPIDIIYQLNLRDGMGDDPRELLKLAVANLSASALKDPMNHQSFINLAIAHIELDEDENAIKILKGLKSIAVSPTTIDQISQLERIIDQSTFNENKTLEWQEIAWENKIDFPEMTDSFKIIFDDSDPLFPASIDILEDGMLYVKITKTDYIFEFQINPELHNEVDDYKAIKVLGKNLYLFQSSNLDELDPVAILRMK